jgi:hypothetical protein
VRGSSFAAPVRVLGCRIGERAVVVRGTVIDVRFTPGATRLLRSSEMTRFANTGNDEAYSITSSARPSSIGGTSRPIAFAALRLITSSNLVGCSTANSPGLAP